MSNILPSAPAFPIMGFVPSNTARYQTANPGGEPGLTSGMWGVGFSAYVTGTSIAAGINDRRNAGGTQGWIFFHSPGAGWGFYACNGASQAGPAASHNLDTPINRVGSIVVCLGVVNVTSNYIQQWADGVKLGQVALGGAYAAFSNYETIGGYSPDPATYPATEWQILSRWSWSGTPSDAQIGTHFDDIAKFGGLCPATLQGVTMRSRYNINQDYSREAVAGVLPTAPTTIRDQVGAQNFTKVGSPGQGGKIHTSYRSKTEQLPLAYSPKTLAELDAFIDGSTPFARYKASSYTVSAGKVTEFIDTLNSANKLTQSNATNRVVTPAADAAFGGAVSATFTGNEGYYSNQAPSTWNFMNNGTGMSIVSIYVATGYAPGGGSSLLISTVDGAGGFNLVATTTAVGGSQCGIQATTDVNGNACSALVSSAHPTANYVVGAWKDEGTPGVTDDMTIYVRNQVRGLEGLRVDPPSSSTSTQSLQLGYYYVAGDVFGNGNAFVGRWVETIIWNRRLTRAELFDVKSWAQKKFSIPQ